MITAKENYAGVWDNRLGFGRKSAVLAIDFMKGYITKGSPLYAPGVVNCIGSVTELLDVAREKQVPLIHTRVRYTPPNYIDAGIWIKKAPVLKNLIDGNLYADFCDEVRPLDSELVITKQYASAFFGTTLSTTLNALGVDTLIITGCTTSGCVRATAVDAVQYGFRPICVRECVGDRHEAPHEANLFDIDSKYGDVISMDECLKYLSQL